ncbi:putative E3 ubiquitin-protein ligase RNF220-like, partial [Triplophysa rosa]
HRSLKRCTHHKKTNTTLPSEVKDELTLSPGLYVERGTRITAPLHVCLYICVQPAPELPHHLEKRCSLTLAATDQYLPPGHRDNSGRDETFVSHFADLQFACKKKVSLYDSQAPICPICQVLLRPGELQEHMEQEMERLIHMHISKNTSHKDINAAPGTPKSLLLSVHIKREGESPVVSPLSSDEAHHSDRYQTFLRVRANRQTRLNARIGKMKRRKPEDGQVCPLCSAPLTGTEEEMSRHVEQCLFKREGATEDDSADMEGENGTRFEEYEWCGQKRVRATTLLEGGFRGTGFAMCSTKESHDSDADLDVDGDDTLEYGKAQYTEADIIPCSGEDQGEAKEREALRGAVLNGGVPSNRITPEFSKWASDEMPSTSNGESSKQEPSSSCSSSTPRTCKNSEIEKITEDSTATTLEALKARIRELEKQILRGDRYKCLICMDSYTMPLTSIQCWHVHCEECWLRTLGNKKLCPQCNTITSPGDLRRVYL